MEILKATKGKVYQRKDNKYVYGKEIHIGENDSVDNWQLINESEIPPPLEPEEIKYTDF